MTTKRRYKRLSSTAWAEITAHWECGSFTLQELSDQFGVTTRALQIHFRKNNIEKGAKAQALNTAVRDEVYSRSLDDSATKVELACEARQRAFVNAGIIESMVMDHLSSARTSPDTAHKHMASIKMLSTAVQALERAHTLKLTALGLGRGELLQSDLPEIIIRDLTDTEILKLQRDAEMEDQFDHDDET
jgi:hypothetical protein